MDPRDLGPPKRLLQARLLELERERWRRMCRRNLLAFAEVASKNRTGV
jgi:hypothetical protein